MSRWIRMSAKIVGASAVMAAGAVAIGTLLWKRTTSRSVKRLTSGSLAGAGDGDKDRHSFFSREGFALLPAPVARYFAFALRDGQPLIRSATLRQTGILRASADATWIPFSAVEHFTARSPGFVWDARCRMAPLVSIRIRDSYIGGAGASEAGLAGLIPFGRQRDTPEVAAASLVRYLAEAAWIPAALLPDEGITWTAVDHTTARATLTDLETTVSIDVQLGEHGGIERISTMRYRDVNGSLVLTPWIGYFRDYAWTQGLMIPSSPWLNQI
jgi:hypothetical protein